jgi:hypothetical protein
VGRRLERVSLWPRKTPRNRPERRDMLNRSRQAPIADAAAHGAQQPAKSARSVAESKRRKQCHVLRPAGRRPGEPGIALQKVSRPLQIQYRGRGHSKQIPNGHCLEILRRIGRCVFRKKLQDGIVKLQLAALNREPDREALKLLLTEFNACGSSNFSGFHAPSEMTLRCRTIIKL